MAIPDGTTPFFHFLNKNEDIDEDPTSFKKQLKRNAAQKKNLIFNEKIMKEQGASSEIQATKMHKSYRIWIWDLSIPTE